jgi:hypothetical protein
MLVYSSVSIAKASFLLPLLALPISCQIPAS